MGMLDNDLPIIEATKPYAFHLDSANNFKNPIEYAPDVQPFDDCDSTLEGIVHFANIKTADFSMPSFGIFIDT